MRGTQTPKSSRSRPLLRNAPSNRGSGLDREGFQAEDHSVRVITRRLEMDADAEELAVKTAPTKCTEQPWERSRPRRLSGRGIIRYGLSLGDLRCRQIPKSSRSRPLLRNTPSNRGSGLDREASRHKVSAAARRPLRANPRFCSSGASRRGP